MPVYANREDQGVWEAYLNPRLLSSQGPLAGAQRAVVRSGPAESSPCFLFMDKRAASLESVGKKQTDRRRGVDT